MELFPDELFTMFEAEATMGCVQSVDLTHENDGTIRNNVPDYLIHMVATWINGEGIAREFNQDRYLLGQLNWLVTNHPQVAKEVLMNLVYQIERVRQGIDEPEVLT